MGWRASASLRRPGAFVFTYHRVNTADDPFPHIDVADFVRHLEWFGRHFDLVAPSELRQAASRPAGRRPPALLTFDDGYRDVHDVVAPILRRYGVPAVAFIVTDVADRPRPLPWDRLFLAVEHARVRRLAPPWAPDRLVTIDGPERDDFRAACRAHFWVLPPSETAAALDNLIAALDPAPVDVERQTMTWDEIRAVGDIVTAGSHTHTHPHLSTISCAAIADEIRISHERLVAETGTAPTFFAYPHGDVSPCARPALTQHGVEAAFTTTADITDANTDWFVAPRIGIGPLVPTRWMSTQSWTLARR